MDSGNPSDSDIVKSVRNMTIGRRGGVRTRGGRLPPILTRELAQITSTKKVVAPKIPQRRKKIEQEVETPIKGVFKSESKSDSQNPRGRGRGRHPKVFIQTDGSFLAEGPAAKIKKEVDPEKYSVPRASKSSAADTCQRKVDSDTIKYILESYEDNETYEDFFNEMEPYRIPPLKKQGAISKIPRIKTEPLDDFDEMTKKEDAVDIKTEPWDDFDEMTKREETVDIKTEEKIDIKTEDTVDIKKETINETEDDKPCRPLKKISVKTEVEFETEVDENLAEAFQKVEGDGMKILLQFPLLTFTEEAETTEKSSKGPENYESEQVSTVLDKLDEGLVGKLQFMKSGKMRLVLGSTVYEVMEGSNSESYMELASMRLTEEGGGQLNVLGKIDRRLLAVPELEKVLSLDKITDRTQSL